MEVYLCYKCHFLFISHQWCSARMHSNFHLNNFLLLLFSLLILHSTLSSAMPRKSDQKEHCSSGDRFISKSNMSRHQKLHARACPQCSQSFPDDETLQRHIATKEAPTLIQKKFSCSSCNSSLSTYYQLIHHKRNNRQQYAQAS